MAVAEALDAGVTVELAVELLDPDPDNVRDELGDVAGLAASIAELGVLEPLLVCPAGDRYTIVFGHRRLRAAIAAKRATVPCTVRELTPAERLEAQLVENLQRQDLSPIEEARGYRRLLDAGYTQRKLVDRVGRSQSHISKRLTLLNLPERYQGEVERKALPVDDAVNLARLAEHPERIALAVERIRRRGSAAKDAVNAELEALEGERLRLEAIAKLHDEGVRVVEYPKHGWWDSKAKPLGKGWNEVNVSRKVVAERGHLAAAVSPTGEVVYVCTDPKPYEEAKRNGRAPSSKATLERRAAEAKEAARKERDAKRAKKAVAATRRAAVRTWLGDIDARPTTTVPGGDDALAMVLTALVHEYHSAPVERVACELLGLERGSGVLRRHAAGGHAWATAVAVAIANVEVSLEQVNAYRDVEAGDAKRYEGVLKAAGFREPTKKRAK